jgi:hypothetical protein
MKQDFLVASVVALVGLVSLNTNLGGYAVVLFWHPLGSLGFLALVGALAYQKLYISAALLAAFCYYVYSRSAVRNTHDKRVMVEKMTDDMRFDPESSIDIQFAEGIAKHDPPHILASTKGPGPLLLYPPSDETLRSMSG